MVIEDTERRYGESFAVGWVSLEVTWYVLGIARYEPEGALGLITWATRGITWASLEMGADATLADGRQLQQRPLTPDVYAQEQEERQTKASFKPLLCGIWGSQRRPGQVKWLSD